MNITLTLDRNTMSRSVNIEENYRIAKEQFGEFNIDTDESLKKLSSIPISIHCWQGDDVGGFEQSGEGLSGGIAVTGNYPGKASTPDELRSDFEKAISLVDRPIQVNG